MKIEEDARVREDHSTNGGSAPVPDRDSGIDTVQRAAQTPDEPLPYAELGLADDEFARIREVLGRRPTSSELAMYSVMWSEHCSYKSSKVHLRQLGEKTPARASDVLLAGMGENAGVVDIGHGYAVTFKIESHNHPSYVEPYQGAATGVGGIVRDILAMGARPIAVMDALRFGPATAPDTRRVLPGVVGGIGGYGNCLGLPNIGGEVVFDPCYAANPLVNALCVGVMRAGDLKLARAPGPGNKVILLGAGTGPDGIGGASVLASAAFDVADADDGDPAGDPAANGGATAGSTNPASAKRPSVQVGDPFLEKLLVECCLELFAADLVAGISDLGAAGLSCATSELASAGTGGMRVELDAVPLRDPTLAPEEILMSESQERMMAIAEPGHVDDLLAICAKWDVPATVIGEVAEVSDEEAARGGRLVVTWHGDVVVDVPPRTVAHEGPVYDMPYARPDDQDALQADDPSYPTQGSPPARPRTGAELRETLLRLVAAPNLAGKTWVTQQYDRYVQGNTVLTMPENLGIPAGRNAGIDKVGGDLVLFLDDDAALAGESFLARAARLFEDDPGLGIAQPMVLDPEGGPTPRRFVPRLRVGDPARGGEIMALWEGACLARRTALAEAGPWPAEFFYMHEGIDLAWRVMDAGYAVRYCTELGAYHPSVTPERHAEGRYLSARNRVWLARRNLPVAVGVLYVTTWFVLETLRLRNLPATREHLRGYYAGVLRPCGRRSAIGWRTIWRMTRQGRPPVI